jgi:hypothetical protein
MIYLVIIIKFECLMTYYELSTFFLVNELLIQSYKLLLKFKNL